MLYRFVGRQCMTNDAAIHDCEHCSNCALAIVTSNQWQHFDHGLDFDAKLNCDRMNRHDSNSTAPNVCDLEPSECHDHHSNCACTHSTRTLVLLPASTKFEIVFVPASVAVVPTADLESVLASLV